jgi:hypothetical protein
MVAGNECACGEERVQIKVKFRIAVLWLMGLVVVGKNSKYFEKNILVCRSTN